MPNPKTLKLVLKGEVPEPDEVHYIAGEIFTFEHTRKIVVPSKKNQQEIRIIKKIDDDGSEKHLPVVQPSAQYQRWYKEHQSVFYSWKRHIIENHGVRCPIMRAKLKILFYFPDSKDRDLGNKAETLYDMLKDTGIIIDDKFKCLKPITLDGWTQRDNPRTELYLTLIEPDSPEYGWDITSSTWHIAQRTRRMLRQRLLRLIKNTVV